MALDLVIRGGLIVDGTGVEPFQGDLGIRDGRVAAVGKVREGAARVLDAAGLAIAPGFWDVHTHYDAQLLWDPIATSSSWHGVTTLVMGNCGFTLAPCRPDDQGWLLRTLARVEAMNHDVVSRTMPWPWESYSQYLDTLEPRLGVNVMTLAGHTTIRRYVMGPEASERAATEAEVERMKQELRRCLEAGAIGLSTSRVGTHVDGESRPVPSRVAALAEVYELASVLREFGRGYAQLAVGSDFNKYSPEGRKRLEELARASGRPVCINSIAQTTTDRDGWTRILEWMAAQEREGRKIVALGNVVPGRREFNLKYTDFFDRYPVWQKLAMMPFEEKVATLRDPEARRRLRADIEECQDSFFKANPLTWNLVYLGRARTAENRRFEGKSVAEIAAALGKHPVDAVIDISLAEGLETQFFQSGNRNPEESALLAILRAPHVVPEQSDAGAHVITEVNTGFPTYLLGHFVRERQAMTLQEAVWRLTGLPAAEWGVPSRGALKEGMAADVVVFDPATVGAADPEFAYDLPGGAPRLIQRAAGIAYTLVNGQVTLEQGRYTGAQAGRVLRAGEAASRAKAPASAVR